MTGSNGARIIERMVDDRGPGVGKLIAKPFRCPACGQTKKLLRSVPCLKCDVEMEPERAEGAA